MKALDTNVVIAVIELRPPHVRARLHAEIAASVTIGIPAIVLFELRYGIAKSHWPERSRAALNQVLGLAVEPWPFEPEDAIHAGEIRAELERRGTPIGHYDLLIAAQARRRSATLVTANTREFRRVPGLEVEDWSAIA